MTNLTNRVRAALDGRYEIDREIGHGGMATVFLARDLEHDRPVAVKLLNPDLAASIGSDRFLREFGSPPGSVTRTSCRSSTRARPMGCCTT